MEVYLLLPPDATMAALLLKKALGKRQICTAAAQPGKAPFSFQKYIKCRDLRDPSEQTAQWDTALVPVNCFKEFQKISPAACHENYHSPSIYYAVNAES